MRTSNGFLVILACLSALLLAGCPPPEGNGIVAAFSATPTTGSAPLAVEFTDESVLPGGASATYQWNFGDGTESAEASPRHTYKTPGEYTVTLTVTTDSGSDAEQKTGYISVLPSVSDSTPISFGDTNLETAVRQALEIATGDITAGDARAAVALQVVDVVLTDLDGLQYFTNLEVLRISGGYDGQTALNLTPLSGLVNLMELYLDGDGVVDLTPLAGLENLEVLHVYDNFIDDISPLANLAAIKTLYLYNNEFSDVSPLSGLTNLTDLNLFGNFIQDPSPLASLTQLRTLYLDNNQVSDLTFLESLTALNSLYLGMNTIADVSPIANLTNLSALGLNDNQITEIQPLATLTNLTALFIDGNPLTAESACPTVQVLIETGAEVYADFDCDGNP